MTDRHDAAMRLLQSLTVQVHSVPRNGVPGIMVRVETRGLDGMSLRNIITGLWAGLPETDRVDALKEWGYYLDLIADPAGHPDKKLLSVAEAIRAVLAHTLEGTPIPEGLDHIDLMADSEPDR